ncbi:MAG: hypothetical protein WAP08_04640 [Smithellaceae bacterium]|nr:hypothetical protein [Syntrophaceae bacterium]HPL97616.1 hypothetical protein [Smithellaceae bacterium]
MAAEKNALNNPLCQLRPPSAPPPFDRLRAGFDRLRAGFDRLRAGFDKPRTSSLIF